MNANVLRAAEAVGFAAVALFLFVSQHYLG